MFNIDFRLLSQIRFCTQRNCVLFLIIGLVLFLPLSAPSAPAPDSDRNNEKTLHFSVHTVTSQKPFDDIIEDLLLAIGEHNFRLTGHARIGQAIAERENINFPKVSVLHFCNLSYAQQLIEIAPELVSGMPCRISVRQTGTGNIIIEVLLLPDKNNQQQLDDFAKKINHILIDIVAEGVS